MSRKDPTPQDSYPGFSSEDGVLERHIMIEDSGDLETCMACKEEYDSASCYPCPAYDGDLETLAETLEEDRLKRGVPLEVPPQ